MKIINSIIAAAISLSFAAQIWAQDFVPILGDVPLAPQIIIDSDSAIEFDSTDGRIAEINGYLSNAQAAQTVAEFYRTALPSLGWEEQTVSGEGLRLRYARDKESLQIDIVSGDKIIFRLQPL